MNRPTDSPLCVGEGLRQEKVSKVRRIFCQIAVRKMGKPRGRSGAILKCDNVSDDSYG
jgi:hypothetical protein